MVGWLTTKSYAAKNGWYLAGLKVLSKIWRTTRDGLLARKLGTTGLGLGRNPRLVGLGHMRIGANFAAADDLWLEAITEFAGEQFHPVLAIGRDCNVSSYVHIACANRVTIGDGLLSGSRVIISDHSHGVYQGIRQTGPEQRPTTRPLSRDGVVVIGKNVWLGDGVVVLPGAVIGDGAIVGANSVVNGEIPADTIAVGTPARVVRRWNGVEWVRVE